MYVVVYSAEHVDKATSRNDFYVLYRYDTVREASPAPCSAMEKILAHRNNVYATQHS